MHLIILVHGMFGKPAHLQCMHKEFCSQLRGQNCVVHLATANSALGTFDGVEACARRTLSELDVLMKIYSDEGHSITSISIVGYSLGGLIARFLIGLLEDRRFFDSVKPFLFATFATPHLGTVKYHNGPLAAIVNAIGANLLGPSGRDLFNKNETLCELANPKGTSMSGLKKFHHLYLFANAVNDRTVPFWTAYITDKSPFEVGSVDIVFSNKPIIDSEKSRWSPKKKPSETSTKRRLLISLAICVFGPILLSVMTFGTLFAYAKKWLGLVSTKYEHKILTEDIMAAISSAVEEVLEENTSSYNVNTQNEDKVCTSGLPQKDSLLEMPESMIDLCDARIPVTRRVKQQIDTLNELPWHKYMVKLQRSHSHAEIVNRRNASQGEGLLIIRAFAKQFSKHVLEQGEL